MLSKVLIASDSFKGSLSSSEVASTVAQAVTEVFPDCQIVCLPVADGGEGTVDAVVDAMSGRKVSVEVSDPLMRPITAEYGIVEASRLAVMEMSAASGLPLLSKEERNPLQTSTFGTGQMIMDAFCKGCRKFLVGIGGSATNDAGTGMLEAMGFKFLDAGGNALRGCGANLGKICSVDDSAVPEALLKSQFVVACDVDTVFCGPVGAAYVFAPQKGADHNMVLQLDEGMQNFAKMLKDTRGKDISGVRGTGAAGGLGGGFLAFLGAKLTPGIEMVLDALDFDSKLEGCNLVITGEGRVDGQTAMGKTAAGILRRCKKACVPAIAVGGCVTMDPAVSEMGFAGVYPIVNAPMSLEDAMETTTTKANLIRTVKQVMTTIKTFSK